MAQEDVHLDDAGLALGLSLGGGGGGASAAARHGTSSSRLSTEAPRTLEPPSLTLSMPDEATATATATGGSGGSGGAARSVSSRSVEGVKRERVDDAEGERASSTAAAARAGAGAEDDDDGSTRKKLRLTKEQSKLLEDRFKDHSTLNPVRRRRTNLDRLIACFALLLRYAPRSNSCTCLPAPLY
jgi:homeobox-leucine zipper protein